MALVPCPPTSADFLASCPKPEVFVGNASAPGIPTATIDAILRQETDSAIAEAIRDYIGPDAVVVQIDEGLAGHIIARTMRKLMSYRGYNPDAGADKEIAEQGKRADDFITRCSRGAEGKRITPGYALATATPQQDSVRVRSARTADEWTRGKYNGRLARLVGRSS